MFQDCPKNLEQFSELLKIFTIIYEIIIILWNNNLDNKKSTFYSIINRNKYIKVLIYNIPKERWGYFGIEKT